MVVKESRLIVAFLINHPFNIKISYNEKLHYSLVYQYDFFTLKITPFLNKKIVLVNQCFHSLQLSLIRLYYVTQVSRRAGEDFLSLFQKNPSGRWQVEQAGEKKEMTTIGGFVC